MKEYILVSFDSSHQAMASESLVSKDFPTSRLIPTPSQVDAGCGLTLRVDFQNKEEAIKLLQDKGIDFKKIYLMTGQGSTRAIKEIRG